jgi:beta-aspartyl-peptidase (threonine type)
VFNREGHNELDASIMSGENLRCGAVAAVRTVKNPIVLARKVMEESKHVLFVSDGAERFADETGVERVDPDYFRTEKRWQEWLQRQAQPQAPDPAPKGTVGVVALDRHGNLAAGTSTGGLTGKAPGRVGDSAVIGAGTYADNRTCAVSGTGKGEEFIRFTVAYRISALMEYRGMTVGDAAREVVMHDLQPGDGGVIALDRGGDVAMVFNTPGMFRGAADSGGRFEVAIWE